MRGIWIAVIGVFCLISAVACTSTPIVTFPEGPATAVTSEPADVIGPLTMRGRELVDATGRVVLIHGTNVVNKSEPFLAPLENGWLGPQDFAEFQADGFNGVRLGVWAAKLMPAPGVIDTDYLAEVAQVIDTLTAQNLWVLLDFHQDVFWGMPSWATSAEAAALSPSAPKEIEAAIGWAANYLSPRSLRQWNDWWAQVPVSDGRSAIDLYGDGVAALANEVKDETNVIGIDLINEPFPGDKFFECVTSCGGRYRQAEAMYTSLTARVNAAAPGLAVWWAPFNIGEPFPDTPAPGANIGYTFHAYCYDTDGGEPVQPAPAPSALCDAVFGSVFSDAHSVSSRWNSPTLLGEFGASQSPLNATRTTQLADEYLFSWMHWHHPGTWPEVVRTQLVRAYAQATAGHPISQRFDPASGEFEFRYRPDESVLAPTSIVLPAVQYPDGYSATVTGGTVTSQANSGRLTVEPDEGAAEVRVHVQRNAPEA